MDPRTVHAEYRLSMLTRLGAAMPDRPTDEAVETLTGAYLALLHTVGHDPEAPRHSHFVHSVARELRRQLDMGVATEEFVRSAIQATANVLAHDPHVGMVDPEVERGVRASLHAALIGRQH